MRPPQRRLTQRRATRPQSTGARMGTPACLAAADREHLEREIAAIERASAALRRAEPELESWVDSPPATFTARLAFDRRAVALHRAGDARRRFRHLGAGGLAARGLSSPRRLGPNARVSDKYWIAAV